MNSEEIIRELQLALKDINITGMQITNIEIEEAYQSNEVVENRLIELIGKLMNEDDLSWERYILLSKSKINNAKT